MKGALKKGTILIGLLLIMAIGGFAAKLATLPEVTTPTFLTLDDVYFYVVQKAEILVYSLKDFKLKHKFGKAGEGPKEFKISPGGEGIQVFPQKDHLVICSQGRMSHFTKDGKFIKEQKVPVFGQSPTVFQPIGDKYVGNGGAMDQASSTVMFTLNTYDADMKKIKEISRAKIMTGTKMKFPMPALVAYVLGDKIVTLGDKEGLSIKILDVEGNSLAEVQKEYKPLKMTDEYKKSTHELFQKMNDTKQFYEYIKQMLEFADEFLPIQFFWAADDKIYIMTYLKEDGKYEFFVFDVKGTFLKRLFIPIKYMMGIRPCPSTVRHDRFYQLVDNEDEEEWELHAYELK